MHVTDQMRQELATDGAIIVRGLFRPEQLQRVRECFDYGIAHPSPMASRVYAGTADEHFNEYGNPENAAVYLSMIKEFGLADLVASLWGSEEVWFLGEELFVKSGGKAGRSPWHQDTSYMPANGPHLANIWISFEGLPRENALEVVRGSHIGVEYDGTSYTDPADPRGRSGGKPTFPDCRTSRPSAPRTPRRGTFSPGMWSRVMPWCSTPAPCTAALR